MGLLDKYYATNTIEEATAHAVAKAAIAARSIEEKRDDMGRLIHVKLGAPKVTTILPPGREAVNIPLNNEQFNSISETILNTKKELINELHS